MKKSYVNTIINCKLLTVNCKLFRIFTNQNLFRLSMVNILQTKIEFLKGVGPKRAELLNKELGIFTFQDLLEYFPFRYVDRSKIHKVNEIYDDTVYYQLVGEERSG